jgi:cysteine desulfuration protein SufE
VWLHAERRGDLIVFEADSEAVIVKGMISMLIRVLSNHTAQEIMQADLYFIEQIGMSQHLAQTRSNGLVSMVKQMKNYALAFSAK